MNLFKITNIGKFFFWLSLILGNICLFGYLLTKNEDFAYFGYLLLIYGTLINGIVFIGLIIHGVFNKSNEIINSAWIMLVNIPIAILYAWIGLSF